MNDPHLIRLSEQLMSFCKFFRQIPWISTDSFLRSSATWIATTKEPIVATATYKAIAPHWSMPKFAWFKALNDVALSYNFDNVHLMDGQEKTDFRFVPEARVAAKAKNISKMIVGVLMGNEKPTEAAFNLILELNFRSFSLQIPRDVKIGNNLFTSFTNKVGEINLVKDTTESYTIVNKPLSLKRLNEDRYGWIMERASPNLQLQDENAYIYKASRTVDECLIHTFGQR